MASAAGDKIADAYVGVRADSSLLAADFASIRAEVEALTASANADTVKQAPLIARKTWLVAAAAALSVAAAVGYKIQKAMSVWAATETVERRLIDTLNMVGYSAEKAAPKVIALAGALQRKTGVDSDAIKSAVTMGLTLGLEEKNIEQYTEAAIGLAARMGTGVEGAMRVLLRATQGNMTMLRRYGIPIDTTKSKEQQLAQVLKFATAGMRVQEGQLNTVTGSMRRYHEVVIEVDRQLGKLMAHKGVVVILNSISESIEEVAAAISEIKVSDQFTEVLARIDDFITGFRALIATMNEYRKAWDAVTASHTSSLSKWFAKTPLGATIDALKAAWDAIPGVGGKVMEEAGKGVEREKKIREPGGADMGSPGPRPDYTIPDKQKTAITDFGGFWKQMQQNANKDEDTPAKETAESTKASAERLKSIDAALKEWLSRNKNIVPEQRPVFGHA